jgi:hypothetical protein
MQNATKNSEQNREEDAPAPPQGRRSRWRWFGVVVAVIAVALGTGRLMLPGVARWYVNRALDENPLYQGKIGDITIHLWRGAYSIHDVRIVKVTGNVPVPFFSAKTVDFAMQWNALLHHKLVGQVSLEQPQLNFVDAPSDAESQTGEGGPWLQMIRDLFPFKINAANIHDAQVHFRTYQGQHPVDVYLDHLDGSIDNLTNIRDDVTPLVTTIKAHGLAMDQADFDFEMKLDPFSYEPAYHMAARLLGLDVTKLDDLALTYGRFDFKRGWLDLVIEVDAKSGLLSGYAKPLFRNLIVFDLRQDVRDDNPLQFFWQALVGVTTQALKNQNRDQFGTLIPFTADLTGTKPDILAGVGNVLRNAFIRAYLPTLQRGTVETSDIEFDPPSPIDSLTTGDQP